MKGLVDKEVLRIEKRSVDRLLYAPKDIIVDFELTTAQQVAYTKLKENFEKNRFACSMESRQAVKHIFIST